MTRKRDEAKVAEARRLHGLGLTTYAIAAQIDADPRTVQRWTAEQARPRGPRPTTSAETDALIVELRSGGVQVTWPALAEEVGMSVTGVRNRYFALTGRPRADRRPRDTAGNGETGEPQ